MTPSVQVGTPARRGNMEIPAYLRTPMTLTTDGMTHVVRDWVHVLQLTAAFALTKRVLPDAYKEMLPLEGGLVDMNYIGQNTWIRVALSDAEAFLRVRHIARILYVNGFLRTVVTYIDDAQTVLPDPADTAE